jgi:hypothetical protein
MNCSGTSQKSRPLQYGSLLNTRSIRILELLPGTEAMVGCRMRTVNLDENPCFTALSYTWNDAVWRDSRPPAPEYAHCDNEIVCNGHTLMIHKNLYDLLLHLRHRVNKTVRSFKSGNPTQLYMTTQKLRALGAEMGQTKYWELNYLWIDEICINQQDLEERSAQIAIMGDIYRAAQSVLVWLGPHDARDREAATVCSSLARIPKQKWGCPGGMLDTESYPALGISPITRDQWKSLGIFVRRSWFSRVWTFQEAVMARQIIVLCGQQVIQWADLERAFEFLAISQWEESIEALFCGGHCRRPPYKLASNFCSNICSLSISRRLDEKSKLLGVIMNFRCRKATELRDFVYAMRAMSNEMGRIIPDYKKPVAEIYTEAAWAFIEKTQALQLLYFVQDHSESSLEGLPSWVPDWSIVPRATTLRHLHTSTLMSDTESRWYPAGDHRWIKPRGNFNSPSLTISVLRIGKVLGVVGECNPLSMGNFLCETLDLASDHLQFISEKSSFALGSEVLWRTLNSDAKREKSDGQNFRQWLLFTLYRVSNPTTDVDPVELVSLIGRMRSSLARFAAWDASGLAPRDFNIDSGMDALREGDRHFSKHIFEDGLAFEQELLRTCAWRTLFRTDSGDFGLGPKSLHARDELVLAAGSDVPLLLRPVTGEPRTFQFVGQAFVHGIMHGEALALLFEENAAFEDTILI